eukprot:3911116-Pyramimonas_sp.AAC.1
MPPLTADDVRGALKRMKARAGMGIDRLSPLDFERPPDCAIEDLVNLFTDIEASLTWPWQPL